MQYILFKKTIYVLLFLGLGLTGFAIAQSPAATDSLTDRASHLFNEANEKEALQTYLEILNHDEHHFEALWHTSLLYSRIGYRLDTEVEMMEHYQKALMYAELALENYPDEGLSHFVYAVANGRISDLSGSKTRVKKSHIVKEHAQKAVEMIPDYAPAWHLFGLWHSKVANIGGAQKFAAGLFSKGVPKEASNEKAVEYILKAIDLDPEQTIRYKLDLGRHYIRAGNHEKATQTLEEVLEIEPENEIDEWNLNRAQKMLQNIG